MKNSKTIEQIRNLRKENKNFKILLKKNNKLIQDLIFSLQKDCKKCNGKGFLWASYELGDVQESCDCIRIIRNEAEYEYNKEFSEIV